MTRIRGRCYRRMATFQNSPFCLNDSRTCGGCGNKVFGDCRLTPLNIDVLLKQIFVGNGAARKAWRRDVYAQINRGRCVSRQREIGNVLKRLCPPGRNKCEGCPIVFIITRPSIRGDLTFRNVTSAFSIFHRNHKMICLPGFGFTERNSSISDFKPTSGKAQGVVDCNAAGCLCVHSR